jgi:hypothetical protein
MTAGQPVTWTLPRMARTPAGVALAPRRKLQELLRLPGASPHPLNDLAVDTFPPRLPSSTPPSVRLHTASSTTSNVRSAPTFTGADAVVTGGEVDEQAAGERMSWPWRIVMRAGMSTKIAQTTVAS